MSPPQSWLCYVLIFQLKKTWKNVTKGCSSQAMWTYLQPLQHPAPAHLPLKAVERVLNYMVPREAEACSQFQFWGEKVERIKKIRGSYFTKVISAKECQIRWGKFPYRAADLLNAFQTCIASFKFNRAVILNMPFSNLILSCTNHWKI